MFKKIIREIHYLYRHFQELMERLCVWFGFLVLVLVFYLPEPF